MKNYKGVIFDLDGTLVDSLEDICDTLNAVFKKLGYAEISYDDCRNCLGFGLEELFVKSLADNFSEDMLPKLLESYVFEHNKLFMNKTKPFAGITELLTKLKNENVKIAVNSNKKDFFTKEIIKKCFPDITFVDVIGDREGISKKPDPFSALEIAEKMNLQPCDILYVGDSVTDMKTAKNASMDSIAVSWGFEIYDELMKMTPTYKVSNPLEIIEYFKSC